MNKMINERQKKRHYRYIGDLMTFYYYLIIVCILFIIQLFKQNISSTEQ